MNTKHVRTLCLTALLLGTACGTDDGGSKDPGRGQQPLKDDVRAACEAAAENGTTPPACPDVWLGDGVCDDFCQGGDADDCTVCTAEVRERDNECPDVNDRCDPDCIACAAIYIEPDGVCPSPDEDPCAVFQDGDCLGDGVICADIAFEKNGCCEAAPGCEENDPGDCGIACTAEERPRDGACNADVCDPDCADQCSPDDGVVCPAIAYEPEGCCDAPVGCEDHDPDCQIACTAEVREPDGECNADYCDPDCQLACAERGDGPVCEDPADCEVHTTRR
jgi:hypothetical protein